MARLVRHRRTKGAEIDRPILPPPRHIPNLPEWVIRLQRRESADSVDKVWAAREVI